MVTKQELTEVLDGLVELIYDWNQLPADEDRGPDNDALCLLIWDDGSGMVSTAFTIPENINQQYEFSDIDTLADYLADWLNIKE